MPVTSPDSIYYPDVFAAASIADITAAMASSIQAALSTRALHTYSWADSTARDAQTGMGVGDIGYQQDNGAYYRYGGSAWGILLFPRTSFTPTWTNFTLGNGTSAWEYWIASGTVYVSGQVTFGSTTSMGANPFQAGPVAGSFVAEQQIGIANYYDLSATSRYYGEVHYDSSLGGVLTRRFNVSGSLLGDNAVTGSSPFTWTTGDKLSMQYSYKAA